MGDQFYLYDNKILCGPDYEERMLFANLHQHPDRLAQLKTQTRLLPAPPSAPPHHSHAPHPAPVSTSAPPHYTSYPPGAAPAPPPKCGNLHPLPPISSVKSLAKRTALVI